jgi:hypothetical protein
MVYLARPVVCNTSRIVLKIKIFQHHLRFLYDCLFIFGIFAPFGASLSNTRSVNGGLLFQFDSCCKVEFFK